MSVYSRDWWAERPVSSLPWEAHAELQARARSLPELSPAVITAEGECRHQAVLDATELAELMAARAAEATLTALVECRRAMNYAVREQVEPGTDSRLAIALVEAATQLHAAYPQVLREWEVLRDARLAAQQAPTAPIRVGGQDLEHLTEGDLETLQSAVTDELGRRQAGKGSGS